MAGVRGCVAGIRHNIRLGLVFLLVGCLTGLAVEPSRAETRLSVEDGRQLAVVLVQAGHVTAAREAALALLSRDPEDQVALLVLARAARDLGLYPEAIDAARRAHRLAEKGSLHRFGASLAMAQALASSGQRGRAQFWLRRAVDEAPDAAARASALRDFNYVRWRNPLSIRLQFNAFPSSNVNGGPTSNTVVIGGIEFINPAAVPLSGLGFSTGAAVSYRWAMGEDVLSFGLSVDATTYRLSDRAKALVPTARSSDYATSQVALSFGWLRPREDGVLSVTTAFGRDWRADAALADWARLGIRRTRDFKAVGKLDFSADLVTRRRLDLAIRSSDELGLGVGWTWTLANGDSLRLGVDVLRVWSESATMARKSGKVVVNWQKAEPVLGMQISAFGSLEKVTYDKPLALLGVQEDLRVELGVTALLEEQGFLGFAPEVGVVLSRTDSNISLMTTEAAELRLGIRSLY